MGNNITDRLKYKESIAKFSRKYGVAKAAYKFGECKRTIQGLYHAMQRLGIYKKTPSKKKESEPNEWVSGEYSGDKVQIDVKYVPKKCMSKELQEREEKFYQYTAIDEYSRLRYTWFTNAHDTYASSELARRLVKYFQFEIKTIQTNHRKDQERFYYKRVFYSLEDLRNQGKEWRKEYNNFLMRPLGWLSPREFIKKYHYLIKLICNIKDY